jgi:hypothetical protein
MRQPGGATRRAAMVGIVALLAGVAWAAVGAIPFGQEPDVLCPGYGDVEGTSYETRATWWPPGGTRCTFTTPAGEARESTYVPWHEWATVAVCALAVALAAFALMTSRHRLRAAYAAIVLLVGGLAIWFVGPIAAVATALAAAPAAVRLGPGVNRRPRGEVASPE